MSSWIVSYTTFVCLPGSDSDRAPAVYREFPDYEAFDDYEAATSRYQALLVSAGISSVTLSCSVMSSDHTESFEPAAEIMAYLTLGMGDYLALDPRYSSPGLEMVSSATQYLLPFLVDAYNSRAEHPRVFVYEVARSLGTWFADEYVGRGHNAPPAIDCYKAVAEAAAMFFLEEEPA